MRIALLQHVAFEGPGAIADWTQERDHVLDVTRFDLGAAAPEATGFDALIVMGGPMGVHDDERYVWMAREKLLIKRTIDASKPVLGICLGAQLIADVMGARVFRNAERELGWFPVDWSPEARSSRILGFAPPSSRVFHWHSDTFDLPSRSRRVASSAACTNQGFFAEDGRIVALQFHLEMRPEDVARLVIHGADELTSGPYVQDSDGMRKTAAHACSVLRSILFGLLDEWSDAG
jgi:GMP synthase-like glutamine amidotransferase